MNIKKHIFFLLVLTALNSTAQISDYFNLKDVKKYRFDRLSLQNETDALKFIENNAEFNFISGLKVENAINLKSVLDKTGKFYELTELNLKNYTGEYVANLFDSCTEVEVLHLSIAENKLAQLSCLKGLKKLNTIYLYIQGKPESLAELKLIPDVKAIYIMGEFLPQHVKEIVGSVNKSFRLNTFGISLDRITDLSPDVVKLRYLSDLIIYDNLSVFSNGGIEELTEEKISLNFMLADDLPAMINVRYLSANNQLAAFETAYLEKIYKGQVLEMKTEAEIAEEAAGEEKYFKAFKSEFRPGFAKLVEFNFPNASIRPDEEVFKIDPTKDAIINTNSGLRLIIARRSFLSLSSEEVTEPVYIKLTEINKPSELLFGGINLNAGNKQYYNNQYLINVQATTARTEVTLKPNYQIKAILPAPRDSSVEYFFDYESNSWQDLNYYNSVFSSTLEPLDFYKMENEKATVNYYLFDTASFDTRYQKQANYFLNDRYNDNQLLFSHKHFYTNPDRTWVKNYNKKGDLKGVRIKKGKSLVRIQKVTPSKRNKERQYFKVVDKTEQQIFSELKALKNINFNIRINPEDKRELTDNFIQNYKYQDVRIAYKAGQNTCTITLKYLDGYKVLTAFVTDSDNEKQYKKQLLGFNKAYKKYLHILHQRSNSFNDNNAIRYQDFQHYIDDKVRENEHNKSTTEIKLNQLGTFSLFKLKPVTFSTNLIVQYTDETGLPVDVKDLFMIDNRYQTVIKLDLRNMAINPATCQLIFATDYNGEMYFANKDDIMGMNLSNNSLTYIKLNKIKVKLNSIEAFNNYIK